MPVFIEFNCFLIKIIETEESIFLIMEYNNHGELFDHIV